MEYKAVDRIGLPETSKINDAGFLVAPAFLARTGIQEYYASELGLDSYPKGTILRLYRPEDEVFAVDSIKSFENSPLTINHPKDWVTPQNWSTLAKGEATAISRAGDFMAATIIAKSSDAIKHIQSGKKELSNGYMFSLDLTAGITPEGKAYDGVQRNIRGNHVAIVDKARCGSACRIFDSELDGNLGGPMAENVKKIVVDGIPLEVTDATAAIIEKLEKQIQTKDSEIHGLNTSINKLEADLKTASDAFKAELEDLQKQVMTPQARDAMVKDWAALLANAKLLKHDIETEGKDCDAIRSEVLQSVVNAGDSASKAVNAILKNGVEKASVEDRKLAFDVALTFAETVTKPTPTQDGKYFVNANDVTTKASAPVGRDKFIQASQDAWKGK